MAVTFSQAEVAAFRTFMLTNQGVLEMDIGDKHYKFESLKAQRDHLVFMESNIESRTTPRTRYAQTSKGV